MEIEKTGAVAPVFSMHTLRATKRAFVLFGYCDDIRFPVQGVQGCDLWYTAAHLVDAVSCAG